MLTGLRDRDGKNICVAIELNRLIQSGSEILEVNDIRSVHGRDAANIILPIAYNNTLKYVDKEKGLAWLSSASSNYQQEITKQDLDTATKVIKDVVKTMDSGKKLLEESKRRAELKDYMMAKHGLERNAYMREQARANDEETERDFAGFTALTGIYDYEAAEKYVLLFQGS